MKSIILLTALGSLLPAASADAKGKPPANQQSASNQLMIRAVHAIALGANPKVKAETAASHGKKVDPDQGDDHASDRAILTVCSHDNPSAQRSAICPTANSPS